MSADRHLRWRPCHAVWTTGAAGRECSSFFSSADESSSDCHSARPMRSLLCGDRRVPLGHSCHRSPWSVRAGGWRGACHGSHHAQQQDGLCGDGRSNATRCALHADRGGRRARTSVCMPTAPSARGCWRGAPPSSILRTIAWHASRSDSVQSTQDPQKQMSMQSLGAMQ